MFHDLFEHLGVGGDTGSGVSTHCLRHTFCTTCLIHNVPVTTVKNWMGHSKIQMTNDLVIGSPGAAAGHHLA